MMKKLLLITFFVTGLCTISAQQLGTDFTVGNLNYSISGTDVLVATKVPSTVPEAVTVPSMVTDPATSITYPVIAIGKDAFRNDATLSSIVIPDGIAFVGGSIDVGTAGRQFQNATELTSITLPIDIGQIPQAFIQGTQLTTITIPEGATTARDFILFNNPLLRSVTLPSTLTSLGTNAFSGSTGANTSPLDIITVLNPTPPTIPTSTFTAFTEANVTLIVPDGSIAAYQAATEWGNFATIIDATGALSITTAEEIKGAVIDASNGQISVTGATLDAVYTISGQRVDEAINLPVGIYIVKISNGTSEEVVKVILD